MRGFTLIELLVVVAIAMAVLAMTAALYVGLTDSGTAKTTEFLVRSIVKRARAEALARHATVVVYFEERTEGTADADDDADDDNVADYDEDAVVTVVATLVELADAPADDVVIAGLILPEGAWFAADEDFARNVALASPPARPGSPAEPLDDNACYVAFNRCGAMISLTGDDVRNNLRLCVRGEHVLQFVDLGINPATGIVQSGHLPPPPPTAAPAVAFLGLDAATRGDWPGNYGASGLVICNYYAGTVVEGEAVGYDLTKVYDYSRLPDYVADYAYTQDAHNSAVTNWGAFQWGEEIRNDDNSRSGLLRPDGARAASSVLANDPHNIQVVFTLRDAQEHIFSIYATENTTSDRYMTVKIAPLDEYGELTAPPLEIQCSAEQYKNGVWFRFRVRGSFLVTLKNKVEPDSNLSANTFVSGFFFDEPHDDE